MISFERQDRRFKYRAAGLCVNDGYVFLTKADQDDYWILPGQHVIVRKPHQKQFES